MLPEALDGRRLLLVRDGVAEVITEERLKELLEESKSVALVGLDTLPPYSNLLTEALISRKFRIGPKVYAPCIICGKQTRDETCFKCTQRVTVEWEDADGQRAFTQVYEDRGSWRILGRVGHEQVLHAQKYDSKAFATAAAEDAMKKLGLTKVNTELELLKDKLRKLPREQRWWG